jgi:hypothetical protein
MSDEEIFQVATRCGDQIPHPGSAEWSFVGHAKVVALVRSCIARDRGLRLPDQRKKRSILLQRHSVNGLASWRSTGNAASSISGPGLVTINAW